MQSANTHKQMEMSWCLSSQIKKLVATMVDWWGVLCKLFFSSHWAHHQPPYLIMWRTCVCVRTHARMCTFSCQVSHSGHVLYVIFLCVCVEIDNVCVGSVGRFLIGLDHTLCVCARECLLDICSLNNSLIWALVLWNMYVCQCLCPVLCFISCPYLRSSPYISLRSGSVCFWQSN